MSLIGLMTALNSLAHDKLVCTKHLARSVKHLGEVIDS